MTHKKWLEKWVKWLIPIVFFFGIAIGAIAQYELAFTFFRSQTEHQWRSHSSQQQIIRLQAALTNLGSPKDSDTLKAQIARQSEIENLIAQSRQAEYFFLTPFASISSAAGTLVLGVITALLGFWQGGKKKGGDADHTTDS